MNIEVQRAMAERGISRLCHFTPSRNLAHIVCDHIGVLATRTLKVEERKVFNPTDLERLDRHEGHICCSIEYPNAWYFDRARATEILFPDWVILFIRPDYICHDRALFCPRNAASGHGAYLRCGIAGFDAMYADTIHGAYGHSYVRSTARLASVPTDDQAEVLIPDSILLRDILSVAVRDDAQAKNEIVRLRLLGRVESLKFVVAPDLFNKRRLSAMLRDGVRPIEEERL